MVLFCFKNLGNHVKCARLKIIWSVLSTWHPVRRKILCQNNEVVCDLWHENLKIVWLSHLSFREAVSSKAFIKRWQGDEFEFIGVVSPSSTITTTTTNATTSSSSSAASNAAKVGLWKFTSSPFFSVHYECQKFPVGRVRREGDAFL